MAVKAGLAHLTMNNSSKHGRQRSSLRLYLYLCFIYGGLEIQMNKHLNKQTNKQTIKLFFKLEIYDKSNSILILTYRSIKSLDLFIQDVSFIQKFRPSPPRAWQTNKQLNSWLGVCFPDLITKAMDEYRTWFICILDQLSGNFPEFFRIRFRKTCKRWAIDTLFNLPNIFPSCNLFFCNMYNTRHHDMKTDSVQHAASIIPYIGLI